MQKFTFNESLMLLTNALETGGKKREKFSVWWKKLNGKKENDLKEKY